MALYQNSQVVVRYSACGVSNIVSNIFLFLRIRKHVSQFPIGLLRASLYSFFVLILQATDQVLLLLTSYTILSYFSKTFDLLENNNSYLSSLGIEFQNKQYYESPSRV